MNTIKPLILAAIVASGSTSMQSALAQGQGAGAPQEQNAARQQLGNQEQVYGSQLMTEQERNAYREKMQSMKTEEERNAFRSQHHEEMQQRARERGVSIPDEPPGKAQDKGRGYSADKPGGGSGTGKGGSKGGGKGG